MSTADQLAAMLADRFPAFDPRKAGRIPPFRAAADAAVAALGGVEPVVDELVEYGGLRGATNAYGVVVARLRWISEDARQRPRPVVVKLRPGEPRPANLGWVDVAPRVVGGPS